MSRKVLGVSQVLHSELEALAKQQELPMTVVMEALIHNNTVDWSAIKADYAERKPTWANIRKRVEEYRVKFPEAPDEQLAALTGFSIPQVETVTHSAHKRCISYLKSKHIKPTKHAAGKCGVSESFIKRIYEQMYNDRKIPKSETYLFTGVKK